MPLPDRPRGRAGFSGGAPRVVDDLEAAKTNAPSSRTGRALPSCPISPASYPSSMRTSTRRRSR
ncbi:hypothetical protein, partial [Rubrivirga sp.]|uniref:hypothetical protein n=1 Tax=Rubrivirga sp. TaxID=1885344 RepID=UPI003C774035